MDDRLGCTPPGFAVVFCDYSSAPDRLMIGAMSLARFLLLHA